MWVWPARRARPRGFYRQPAEVTVGRPLSFAQMSVSYTYMQFPQAGRTGGYIGVVALALAVAVVAGPGCRGGDGQRAAVETPASTEGAASGNQGNLGTRGRPNVLLVTIDTLRADHCSAYGYEVETTPVLRELARNGVLFKRAYAPSATTAPSHAALLTSRYPRSLGILKNGHSLEKGYTTLAEVLAGRGYATAAFVSSAPLRSHYGFSRGFEHFDDSFKRETVSLGRNGENIVDRRADATVDAVRTWLDGRKAPSDGRPLFAWVHFVDPHAPYHAPESFDGAWPQGTQEKIRAYDGEVRFADRQLGRLLDAFRAAEGERGTLVVVTSDHGEGLGDHGWMWHGVNLHEELVRVPLVVSWPQGGLPQRSYGWPVELLDVAPGILRLLSFDVPREFEGRNMLVPRADDEPVFLQRRVYRAKAVEDKQTRGEMTAMVRNNWKYVWAPEDDGEELYRLVSDPQEKDNLADREKARGGRMATTLERWRRRHPVPEHPGRDAPLAAERLRELRALGYVD